jgi:hypothetical protein
VWKRDPVKWDWHICVRPYSFYHEFIKTYWAGGPSQETAAPIHRLCTLARKMSVRSFVIENGFERRDVINEIKHLEEFSKARHDGATDGREVKAVTITFLTSDRPTDKDVGKIDPRQVIGQVVIITFPVWNPDRSVVEERSYIYEAVFRLPSKAPEERSAEDVEQSGDPAKIRDFEQLLNNYVPVSRELEIFVRERRVSFRASYFCQQNGVTSICGHCAVRTLVRIVADKRVTVPQLNTFWEYADNEEVRIDDVERALKRFGQLSVKKYRLDKRPIPGGSEEDDVECSPDEIWDTLSRMADSAVASLLVLSSGRLEPDPDHVVPVLGHTFNSDEWHPLGRDLHRNGQNSCATSTLWVDHIVVHDDMLGPYYCLSRGGLFPGNPRLLSTAAVRALMPEDIKLTANQAKFIARRLAPGDPSKPVLTPRQLLAVLPKHITRTPIDAEDYAQRMMGYVEKQIEEWGQATGTWWDYFGKCFERRVLRTTLVGKDQYIENILGYEDENDDRHAYQLSEEQVQASKALADVLPAEFWLAEVTLPNLLLANRAKLGELLVAPSDKSGTSRAGGKDGVEPTAALLGFRMPSVLGIGYQDPEDQRRFALISWPEAGHRPLLGKYHSNSW